ncbi:MAG TPA: FAD-dependent monooxygenase, partial [Thermomicrobiales bacterium]|nr:FAD-dependent monooxygenase [Thermomicrobiales bacterium]
MAIEPPAAGVLVVGAGPTGLTLAAELVRRGVPTRLIDRDPGLTETSRALGTQPRTREVFDLMGIPQSALQPSVLVRAVTVHAGPRVLARVGLVGQRPGQPYGGILVMSERDTERALLDHLRQLGGAVEWNHELVAFSLDKGGVSAVIRRDGRDETARAAWIVGCDGARSTVRRLLDVRFEGTAYEEAFALADVRLDWDRPRDEGFVWFSPAGVFFTLPLPEPGRWRLIVSFAPGQTPGPLSL